MFEILTKGWMLKLRCCGRKFSTNQVWRKMMQETIYSWCSRVEHFQYILSLYSHDKWEQYIILSLPIYSCCCQFQYIKDNCKNWHYFALRMQISSKLKVYCLLLKIFLFKFARFTCCNLSPGWWCKGAHKSKCTQP